MSELRKRKPEIGEESDKAQETESDHVSFYVVTLFLRFNAELIN